MEIHARLDAQLQHMDLRRLADYRGFLEVHAAVVLPLETTLVASGVEQIFPDWNLRARSDALGDDLAHLGGVVRPRPPLPLLDFDAVLGTMYVLEGSRLGARALLGMVLQSSEASIRQATRYLGHGAGSRLWPDFLQMLQGHAATVGDPAKAIDAARRTFVLFEDEMADFAGSGLAIG
jgi:heme oxygenase